MGSSSVGPVVADRRILRRCTQVRLTPAGTARALITGPLGGMATPRAVSGAQVTSANPWSTSVAVRVMSASSLGAGSATTRAA
jgi:hypothetical protein